MGSNCPGFFSETARSIRASIAASECVAASRFGAELEANQVELDWQREGKEILSAAASNVFLSLALLIAIGVSIQYLFRDLDIDDLRRKLHRLVLAIFLPALIFRVIYRVEIKAELWQIPVCAFAALIVTLILGAYIYAKVMKLE